MSKTRLAVLFLSLTATTVPSGATAGPFTIVVNASRPATLTREQVAEIFMKRAVRWSDGTPVTPFDLSVQDPTRQVFSKEVLGQSSDAIVSYWQHQLFTGRVKPPLVKTPTDLLQVVASTPGAIGYVSEGTELPEGVKAVTVVAAAK
jgi:ABC-type phosphate transport system substrate-binding protein